MINPNILVPIAQAVAKTTVKILVYGFAGAGKTTLLGSLPGKGLILSAEAGLLSLRRLASVFHEGTRVITVPAGAAGAELLAEVLAHLKANPTEFAWVALDSLSEIAEVVLSSEKSKTKDPRQAYGALQDTMGKLLRDYRDLADIDVYFSAKCERVKDDSTGKVSLQVSMPGAKLGQALPYVFDEVLFLKKLDDGTRVLQTDGDAQVIAKDRSGALNQLEQVDAVEEGRTWGLGRIIEKIKAS